MIVLIEKLTAFFYSYFFQKNTFIFNVKKYIHYGCLSRRSLKKDLQKNYKTDNAKYKINPEILYKRTCKNDEPAWSSP